MLEKIKYINHVNEVIEWGKNGIYVNYNDLHDYSWDFESKNNRVSSFDMGIVTKTVPIIICCKDQSQGLSVKNQLLEVAEKDVLAMEHGKLIMGDYYLKCFITGSKKSNYLVNKGYLEASLKIVTDFPQWVKETTVSFYRHGSTLGQGSITKRNFDYNFDFPFDYTSEMINKRLDNTGFMPSEFQMIIYGSCINPTIHIAGHTYQVNAEISENEYLTINSINKKIVLTKYNGREVNCFKNRNKESYIFEKIPVGENIVTWEGSYGFDVTLFEERSEPKWI